MYQKLLHLFLKRNITRGFLVIQYKKIKTSYGNPSELPRGIIEVNNKSFFSKVINKGEVGLGESYIDYDWDSPNVPDVLLVLLVNSQNFLPNSKIFSNLFSNIRHTFQKLFFSYNSFSYSKLDSKKGMSIAYDVSNDFFKYMLGSTKQYTCAIFQNKENTLDEAQNYKINIILKKLRLNSSHNVLDIGCGWGNLLNEIYQRYSCHVNGIALAKEQIDYCKNNYRFGKFDYLDYRDLNEVEKYDRIVSVGMMEHIGPGNFSIFIEKIEKLLKQGGLALLHTMISGPLGNSNLTSKPRQTFAHKYIMPCGYIPNDFEVTNAILKSKNLRIIHQEKFGIHYGETMLRWRENVLKYSQEIKNINKSLARIYDYTWSAGSACFISGYTDLWQILIEKSPISNEGVIFDPRS